MTRIALLKPCCIGDVVLATALLAAIRRGYPDATIDWLVGSWSAAVVADHPALNRVSDLGAGANPARTPRGLAKLIRTLRAGHYDLLLVPDRSRWLSLAALLSGIPCRVGLDSAGRGFGYTRRAVIDPHEIRNEADIYLDLARALGLAVDGCWANVTPTPDAIANVRLALQAKAPSALAQPLVIVHPGGGVNPGMTLISKRWPPGRVADLTQRVADSTNGVIIVIGSASDKPNTQAVIEALPRTAEVVDLTGALTLPQIVALAGLPNVALYIGNDTGTAHLAAAAGARTLMIFGPSDPRRYGPFVPPEHAAYAWRPVSVPDRGVAAGGMAGFDWERDGVTVAEAWVPVERLLSRG